MADHSTHAPVPSGNQEPVTPPVFPRFALLESMQLEAKALMAARVQARLAHNSRDIRSAGDIVENAVRQAISKRLPSRYRTGHGHIVNPILRTSPQLDIIVFDGERFTPLFTGNDGTDWLPCESVLAFGEVKSSYEKSKGQIQAFSGNIRRIRTGIGWPRRKATVTAYGAGGVESRDVSFTPVFAFLVFVDSTEFQPDHIAQFYQTTGVEDLPNLIYFVDKGVLLNMKFGGVDGHYPMEMNLYPEVAGKMGLTQYPSRWCLRLLAEEDHKVGLGMGFFTFLHLLMSHLEGCSPQPASLLAYYALADATTGSRMHLHIFD
jgi:hypothetical protein